MEVAVATVVLLTTPACGEALSILYLIKFINDLQSLIKFVMLFTTSTQQIRKISTHIADNSDLKDIFSCFKKSLKIPKGQSESVYLRRTNNTMAKRKSTNNDVQNIHIKLKIE
jgi:hypothetical protein